MCKNIYLQFKSNIPRANSIQNDNVGRGEIHAGESFFSYRLFPRKLMNSQRKLLHLSNT